MAGLCLTNETKWGSGYLVHSVSTVSPLPRPHCSPIRRFHRTCFNKRAHLKQFLYEPCIHVKHGKGQSLNEFLRYPIGLIFVLVGRSRICPRLSACVGILTFSWMKVFRIIPEFRILRPTFCGKSASKC